ncbi:MAG: hypothetical protein JHC80_03805 [Polynucleobacter sp.]|jgi:hypothetical protein|nr:hypothetical protein [Polynucleobacter sp.]
MQTHLITALLLLPTIFLISCSTPQSDFKVYKQSDGQIGVLAPKSAKESESQEIALKECKKMGKSGTRISEMKPTLNDNFPTTYLYVCVN